MYKAQSALKKKEVENVINEEEFRKGFAKANGFFLFGKNSKKKRSNLKCL